MKKVVYWLMCVTCIICLLTERGFSITISNEQQVYTGASTVTLTVPQTYVISFVCGEHGCVMIDDVLYKGTASLIITNNDVLDVSVVPFEGYILDTITASSREGYTINNNVITVSNALQDLTFILDFTEINLAIMPSDIVIAPNMELQLSIPNLPSNVIITWNIDDNTIASIDENGLVHTKQNGQTLITASVGENSSNTSLTIRELNTLTMPNKLVELCDEAMMNNTAIENVVLSTNLSSIGKKAFAGCVNLRFIRIPNSVTSIGEDCFLGCNNLIIICSKNSVAYSYATEHGIICQLID